MKIRDTRLKGWLGDIDFACMWSITPFLQWQQWHWIVNMSDAPVPSSQWRVRGSIIILERKVEFCVEINSYAFVPDLWFPKCSNNGFPTKSIYFQNSKSCHCPAKRMSYEINSVVRISCLECRQMRDYEWSGVLPRGLKSRMNCAIVAFDRFWLLCLLHLYPA